ncbi:MAG: hypothetical protein J6K32_06030, partial [Clostridia bacterium]|nr:hypothetical protein [Clostridia bacterium]
HQEIVYRTICELGPLNIQQLKQETGLLVRELTPALHRLQEAFLLYEDQYDGEWDRPWMRFEEMFPDIDPGKYTRIQALEELLLRYAFRMVFFTTAMAKDFYRVPERECRAAVLSLCSRGCLIAAADGYMRPEDAAAAQDAPLPPAGCAADSVIVMHRNDMLVRSFEHDWKPRYKQYALLAAERCPEAAGFEVLQLLIMDGAIHGATLGKFKYGPYIIEDIAVDEAYTGRREEILAAVRQENPGSRITRFAGEAVLA